jgi:SAM-dependent methyltransferase
MMILDQVKNIRPDMLLDIGCGCGHFSVELTPYSDNLIISDISPALVKGAFAQIAEPGTLAVCMDALNLAIADNSIDTVIERFSLHHMANWHQAVDEMYRVAQKYILIDEPIDDERSQSKRDSILAWQIYLDVQKEVGYSHFRHIQSKVLLEYVRKKGLAFEYDIVKSDELISFDEFFSEFGRFVEKSNRPLFWYDKLRKFKEQISARPLCRNDILSIVVKK